jgi:hypothetical protein
MDKLKIYTYLFLLLMIVQACKPKKEIPENAIARVNETYLNADVVRGIIPAGSKPEDSTALAKQFINNWIREQLMLSKAEQNLTDEQKNVEKQLADYRSSLISYIYQRELVNQKLDTVVTPEAIEEYYNNNKSNFELKDNIIKVIYIKVDKKAPKLDKLRLLYKSEQAKDKEALEAYCKQYAQNFFLDENSWLLFNDLIKEIPIQPNYNQELFLQNNRFIELGDSTSLYFVNIKGVKIKNSLSPLAFEKENIKNIILNKRKLDLINSMKDEVFNEALTKKEFEIFE